MSSSKPAPHKRISTDSDNFELLLHLDREWKRTAEIAEEVGEESSYVGGHLAELHRKEFVEKRGNDTTPEWRVSVLGMGVRDHLGDSDE